MGIILKGKYLKPLIDYFGSEDHYDLDQGCIFNEDFDTLVESVASVYREHITPSGAYRIMASTIWEFEDWFRAEMEAGKEFLEQDLREKLVASIVQEFATYPRRYELTVSLPHVNSHASCDYHLTEGVEVIGGRCTIKFDEKIAKIKLIVEGHCDPHLGSESIATGLRELKLFAFLMQWKKFAVFPSAADAAGATILDLHSFNSHVIKLPREVALMLGGMRLSMAPLVQRGQPNTLSELPPRARAIFEGIGTLMQILAKPDNDSLATAIEWLMDSMFVENQTVAFLEVCIGMEALLGEQGHMNDMTNRLCDRLAYLLGRSRQERSDLGRQYKDILELRGKLVHSKKARLSPEDYRLLNSARELLGRVISIELQSVT